MGINVLSLFDGISCGQLALARAGIAVDNYYSCEIDKTTIAITQQHFPNTIQLGDIQDLTSIPTKIDLVIGGSPCQGFSFAGKQLNFVDPRSRLFFEFVRILGILKPKYFLLENVVMKEEYQEVISTYLNTKPLALNSALVSAQNRRRLYWTNLPAVTPPLNQGITLSDVMDLTTGFTNKASIIGRRLDARGKRQDYNKEIPITQCIEVRASNTTKSNCLTTVAKDTVLSDLPVGRHPDAFNRKEHFRYYTKDELCRLQTIPTDYFPTGTSYSAVVKMVGNAWTVDMLAHIFSFLPHEDR